MKRLLWAPLLTLAACGPAEDDRERVLLVTTTTVEASGLLETLVDVYHASQDRYHLSTTAVGSGAALEIGRRGDADLLLTHDPTGEARFMAEGHGAEQGPVMRNEFVIVGPPEDPAGIRDWTDLGAGLRRIGEAGARFISRADDSGTHRKERELWTRAGSTAPGSGVEWYLETGSGMDETLRVADQRGAYALTDRGTFRHLRDGLRLEVLARGDPPEVNTYQYTLPGAPGEGGGARDLLDWLLGPGQKVIGGYGLDRFEEPLFTPAAPTS